MKDISEINHCAMFIYTSEYDSIYDGEVEFMITLNKRTQNKIKLTNVNYEGFNRRCIDDINPVQLKNNFKNLISLFKEGESYTLPYGIMLQIMKEYNSSLYEMYLPYHNTEDDNTVIDHMIWKLNNRCEQLLSLKETTND